jgi:glycosyltransferase involved in cell wall biosynthesis
MDAPLVSVIIATYNRGNVLAHALTSVRRQTVTDWEAVVVGDACTDDTAAVVAGFHDPRITFFNLPVNCGSQHGPNNEGVRRARGRYLAYLNHDDLWFPDHLARALAELETTGADLVYTLTLVQPKPGSAAPPTLRGPSPDGRYSPRIGLPATSWVFRRELAEAVGPWRSHRELHATPSQDWLFRAWRAGKDLRLAPHLTAVAFSSGKRKGCYARREEHEQRVYLERMAREPDLRQQELTRLVLAKAKRKKARLPFWERSCLRLGLNPRGVVNFLRYRRRGGVIDYLRELRGLSPAAAAAPAAEPRFEEGQDP